MIYPKYFTISRDVFVTDRNGNECLSTWTDRPGDYPGLAGAGRIEVEVDRPVKDLIIKLRGQIGTEDKGNELTINLDPAAMLRIAMYAYMVDHGVPEASLRAHDLFEEARDCFHKEICHSNRPLEGKSPDWFVEEWKLAKAKEANSGNKD